jgi:cation:H+ antiporter
MKSLFSKILRQPTQSLRGAQPAPTQTTFVLPVILLMLAAPTIRQMEPSAALWATPAILMAAMVIAWAAESAQFFIAQGFALAILAWLQTLPEFAVEAVLAWRQRTDLLMANLTGSLRLLTGLGWPMIYFVAAACHRARRKKPLRSIPLADEHCVEVVGLLAALLYSMVIYAKGSLTVWDGLVLILIYAVYLMILGRMPPQEAEGIEDLELIPRTIVKSRRPIRIALIFGLFLIGGLLIYFMAEPFLGSLLSVSIMLGVQPFVFVQWVAPFVSEFPEKVSAFYWARTIDKASMALMNMVSSNINQWTLLAAMLPMVYSWSCGTPTPIVFDDQQKLELLMTIGQSLVGMMFLINMRLDWWEAAALFSLWGIQFVLSPIQPGPGMIRTLAGHIHWYVTIAYFIWFGIGILRYLAGQRKLTAFHLFGCMWRNHIRPQRAAVK